MTTEFVTKATKPEIEAMVREYREKLYKQAEHLRQDKGVIDVETAVKYVISWGKQDQIFNGGVMQGKRLSFMKICALLSHAIEPVDGSDISINESLHGWDIYWKARDHGMFG